MKSSMCPRVGNVVRVGFYVTIIGDITIGNNVNIVVGSVSVKDVPDYAVLLEIRHGYMDIKYNNQPS